MLHNKRKSVWRQKWLLIVAAVLVVAIVAGCGAKNEEGNEGAAGTGTDSGNVVATYKDGQVTETEFNKYTTFFGFMNPQYEMILSIPQYKEQFLKEYVGYKVLYDRASDELKEETNAEADTFEEQFKTAVESQPEMKAKLDAAGLTIEEAKQYYHLIITVMKDAESKVTDEQVKAEYDKNPENYTKASVRHILVGISDPTTGEETRKMEEALARANEVKDKLENGGDWNALAKEYSDDPGSKENGGLYEDVAVGGWAAGFKEAALSQPIGEIGEPVETEFGYHVMKVEKREEQTFEQLPEETKTSLKQTVAGTVLNEFMTNELPDLEVVVTLPKEEVTEPAPTEGEGNAPAEGEGNAPAEGEGNASTGNNAAGSDAAAE
ncbi:peptidylprolyl isomerase [Paenibacillus abyssi]|uniref:PpiC domain-containing protein n=1 Tax=Paenibacillus abyssi TaxID=1340531 RepID=A0A917G5U8_9BACL|nr:peptidylprolyl isomerase [Paenibacillus abyssi]GGG24629.1 hypothetical protein GCM10010916_46430 [Paenibacillus abyssi]